LGANLSGVTTETGIAQRTATATPARVVIASI
jgi:hypothetical protein